MVVEDVRAVNMSNLKVNTIEVSQIADEVSSKNTWIHGEAVDFVNDLSNLDYIWCSENSGFAKQKLIEFTNHYSNKLYESIELFVAYLRDCIVEGYSNIESKNENYKNLFT